MKNSGAREVIQALNAGKALMRGNVSTDGVSFFLFGNKIYSTEPPIVELPADAMRHRLLCRPSTGWFTFAGWATRTTTKYLVLLTDNQLNLSKGRVYASTAHGRIELSTTRWYSQLDLADMAKAHA